ncbi:uncharacterized protein LOC131696336 [Topomyia yanbarensis]|uniref:uncharacterized protein LOC131696336 n=1 Tax=Topomyia yanbarensis TaxID=2498891 RepID=UPI00273CA1B6|nr:uncharacterized protein LOC131696336 [Topomyia yanbarensis]
MSTERRIKSLKLRQRSIQTSFDLIKAFVNSYEDDTDASQVPVRLEHLVSLWSDFNKVQTELESLDEVGIEQQFKYRTSFESSYYKVKGFLLIINKTPVTPCVASSSPYAGHFPPSASHVRLPDVKLPVFNGNLDNWLNFHDLYLSLVHSSAELSNIQKFYYLRSSLTGDALKLVQTIPISANNYAVAWNMLVDHYQNPARLKQTYVDALFDFATIKRESASDLHSLVEKFEANVKVLQQLGEQTQYWDIILIRMLSIRLDSTTRRDWEEYASTKDTISFNDLTAFIQRRVTVLQNIHPKAVEAPAVTSNVKRPNFRPVASNGASQFNPRKCVMCSEHHPLYQCSTFSKMPLEDKEREVRRHQLCRNCLRRGHLAKDCSSSSTCRKCQGHHHTQLCASGVNHGKSIDSSASKQSSSQLPEQQSAPSISATVVERVNYSTSSHGRQCVLLATAVVILVDDNGNQHTARALLDSGSECCFISEALAQTLKVQRKKISLPIAGIGQSSTQARQKFATTVRSRISNYTANLEFLVLPRLTVDLPTASVDITSWRIPPEIQLADPSFCKANPVDLILGVEVFFDLFKVSGRIPLGDSMPVLVNSVLGWIVAGKTTHCKPITPVVANVATISDIHKLMEKFWTLEEGHSSPCYSVEEAECEEHFRQTVSRAPEGRYIVRLPLKRDTLANLSDNRGTAIRRFHLLERRLARNEELSQRYSEFMDEYYTLGHMERVDNPQAITKPCFHLPHHAVVRESSSTTKVRVVFDASCKSTSGPSLNDALMIGPIVQDELRSIIMRSRKHSVMLIADIKQMFRQILLHEQDTPLQRIVWRNSTDAPIDTFELKTVTYGTASAPFLATRVLKQLAEDERTNFPEATAVLEKDFYVDDLFTGARNINEATTLRKHLQILLAKGGFELRKWASNEEAVLEGIPNENRALQPSVDFHRDQCIKTLGLHWEPASDVLRYKIQLPSSDTTTSLTKRIALSQIAQLFDPLGLVGPVVTTAKLYMQALWTMKDENGHSWGWDQVLPKAMIERWIAYQSQLPLLNELSIERCVLCPNPTTIQLHLFSDASERAYGACVYVRSTNSAGTVKVALLTTKSKIAPLKQQTIPRLELCGALLAAQLYERVVESLQLPVQTFFWVDSTTVLSWLQSPPTTWTTFVANRVSKIQQATVNCTWRHVAGKENPADHLSRGMTAETLLECVNWWQGTTWLHLDDNEWPIQCPFAIEDPEASIEARKVSCTVAPVEPEPSFIDQLVSRFSQYQRMLRIVAYCLRFPRNCQLAKENRPENTCVTVNETQEAETILIRLVQQQSFVEEWRLIEKSMPVSTKSRIKWFHPMLSSPERLMRIGGRINQSQQPYDAKHQIILPSSHHLSTLLVRSYHERHLHAAPQLLVSILRLRYWIIGARNLARTIVHKCVVCVRARPKLIEQFMAELPAKRIIASRPFSATGVDYWGPILLQPPHRRAAARKAYVAVFICFCTKAVHLELVADLSTQKFIQALRRFVARRGLCSNLYSDNGRNFVGAANELKTLIRSKEHQQAIFQECNETGIKWHFNPPKASHFGGLWEAAIQSAQKHFVRVLGNRSLAHDDMETLLAQIESCLNSRPIVPLSDDPSDYNPLTPGHFLTGSALKAVPDVDLSTVPFNRLRQWQQTQKILQDVWRRWHTEYLSTLQARTKWCNPPVQLAKNQLVIIKEENLAPMRWPTARIHELHPGPDGITRVVTLQTPQGKFTRPVAKLCLLPVVSSDESKAAEADHLK